LPFKRNLQRYNAVVAGMVRSKQMRIDPRRGGRSRTSQRKVLGLLLHGDAVGLFTLNQVDPYSITYSLSNP
jgi:2-oxoglutarate dehydrogenase complex dehydrogenase (E1) component-like enzyme